MSEFLEEKLFNNEHMVVWKAYGDYVVYLKYDGNSGQYTINSKNFKTGEKFKLDNVLTDYHNTKYFLIDKDYIFFALKHVRLNGSIDYVLYRSPLDLSKYEKFSYDLSASLYDVLYSPVIDYKRNKIYALTGYEIVAIDREDKNKHDSFKILNKVITTREVVQDENNLYFNFSNFDDNFVCVSKDTGQVIKYFGKTIGSYKFFNIACDENYVYTMTSWGSGYETNIIKYDKKNNYSKIDVKTGISYLRTNEAFFALNDYVYFVNLYNDQYPKFYKILNDGNEQFGNINRLTVKETYYEESEKRIYFKEDTLERNYYYYIDLSKIDLSIKVNNEIKKYDNGKVKINNQLRYIDSIWIKINNELREV